MTNRDSLLPADALLSGADKIIRIPFTFTAATAAVSNGNTGLVIPIKQVYGYSASRRTVGSGDDARAMRVQYLITALVVAGDVAATYTVKEHQLTTAADITDATKVVNISNYAAGTNLIGGLPVAAGGLAPVVLPFNMDGWALAKGAITITASVSVTGGGVIICRELI